MYTILIAVTYPKNLDLEKKYEDGIGCYSRIALVVSNIHLR
jgi:hypothetical protein